MANNIPIIDFAQAAIKPDIIAEEVLQACTDWGKFAHRAVSNLKNLSCIDDAYAQVSFFVKNHPIPQHQVDEIFELVSGIRLSVLRSLHFAGKLSSGVAFRIVPESE